MSDDKKYEMNEDSMIGNFDSMLPRNITGAASIERDKQGSFATDFSNFGAFVGAGSSSSIYRNPSRRFYDPELTTTAVYLPKQLRQKNRWRRWFFDHDELIGTILELHSELPHSRAEVIVDDTSIRKTIEECLDTTNFFSMLPFADLEFMKIGEVFIHNTWSGTKGMWDHIVIHNPDYLEVKFSPFADQEAVIELLPDEELKSIIHSTKPEEQRLKKRLPQKIVKRVLTGKNIILDPDEITHIARRSNPYDVRGTSIIDRIFRTLMLEDKYRESQVTIADNFIYPLKLFRLGDKNKGWIPNEKHQKALAQMLQQANFDPNFSLIYHYGLEVDYITVADKLLHLDKEWTEINERKMVALGVSKQFIGGDSNYASANVGLQTQLARYRAKRDLFEQLWIRDKFFRIMAERNGWYRRDAKEIVGQYRVSRDKVELKERLILPELSWHKKLMLRDDQAYLTFLNNVYAQGKGPISAITLLMSMGLDLADELERKNKQIEFEKKYGISVTPPAPTTPGGMPPLSPMGGGIASKIKDKFKFGKIKQSDLSELTPAKDSAVHDDFFTTGAKKTVNYTKISEEDEIRNTLDITQNLLPATKMAWNLNLKSERVPEEAKVLFNNLNNKVDVLYRKSNGQLVSFIQDNIADIKKALTDIYMFGKIASYSGLGTIPIYSQYYNSDEKMRDFSDIMLSDEFESWVHAIAKMEMSDDIKIGFIRDLGNTCFGFGQIKGYQEQGIYNIRLGNVKQNEGFIYNIKDLLEKGQNLSTLLAPNGDILVFSACIDGFDDRGNNIDSTITRYKDFVHSSIKIKDCPVEHKDIIVRLLTKLGKYIKKEYDMITFVDDVTNTAAWEQSIRDSLVGKDEKEASEMVILPSIKLKKFGKIPIFNDRKDLYISNWVGREEGSLMEKLVKELKINEMDSIKKALSKIADRTSYNLSSEELNTYKALGYLEPLVNESSQVIGWGLKEDIIRTGHVSDKLLNGKSWLDDGRCINSSIDQDPEGILFESILDYLDFNHKLSVDKQSYFNKL